MIEYHARGWNNTRMVPKRYSEAFYYLISLVPQFTQLSPGLVQVLKRYHVVQISLVELGLRITCDYVNAVSGNNVVCCQDSM